MVNRVRPRKEIVLTIDGVKVVQVQDAPILNQDDPDVSFTFMSGLMSIGSLEEAEATRERGWSKVQFGPLHDDLIPMVRDWVHVAHGIKQELQVYVHGNGQELVPTGVIHVSDDISVDFYPRGYRVLGRRQRVVTSVSPSTMLATPIPLKFHIAEVKRRLDYGHQVLSELTAMGIHIAEE